MKLYKNFIFIIFLLTGLKTQEISGTYRLTGFSAVSYDISRTDFPIMITDSYGLGIIKEGDKYTEGELINKLYQEAVPEFALLLNGVTLTVSFNSDGSGFINDSTYPTISTDEETCIASETIPPITDSFVYTDNVSQNYEIPYKDIFGNESLSPYKGLPAGNFSLNGSIVFDNLPSVPTEVSIPYKIDSSVLEDSSTSYLPGEILPGLSAGYLIYSTELASIIDGNPQRPSLYLEWHAIDGELNDSGFGDEVGVDEDGDGTDYDTIYGLENLRSFEVNAGTINNFYCGSNNLIISGNNLDGYKDFKIEKCNDDVTSNSLDLDELGYLNCTEYIHDWFENCVDQNMIYNIAETRNLYSLDLDSESTMWDGLTTWNSLNNIPVNDSTHDYNPECETDEQIECSGRITFDFEAQCLLSLNARYFMAELTKTNCEIVDECDICDGNGPVIWYEDSDGDGYGNISSPSEALCLPPTNYVSNNLDPDDSCINKHLNYDCSNECINDSDTDGICDEFDQYPNCFSNIVDCSGICDGNAIIGCDNICDSNLEIDLCGVCGGNNSSCTDCAGIVNGTNLEDMCGICDSDISNDCEIDCDGVWGGNNSSCLSVGKNIIEDFRINNIYPNPFNPDVVISYQNPTSQHIEINIYNLNGLLITNLISEYQLSGVYNIKWNASNHSSGIYIITLISSDAILHEKLVLLK